LAARMEHVTDERSALQKVVQMDVMLAVMLALMMVVRSAATLVES
jgi:hypothetical protein